MDIEYRPAQPIAVAASSTRAFIALDALRGVAALAVAVRHAPFGLRYDLPGTMYESYLAVDFFFVLSGFVLAYAYGERLRTRMSIGEFMATRLIRLYPLYLLALILTWSMSATAFLHDPAGGDPHIVRDSPFAVLFLPSPLNERELYPINYPAWSLFFELLANLGFALIAKRLSAKLLMAIVTAAALTLVCAVAYGWFGFGTGDGPMDAGSRWMSFGAGAARVAFAFSAGILVFRIWAYRPFFINVPALATVIVLCALLMCEPPPAYRVAFDLCTTIVIFPALVYVGASCIPGPRAAALFTWLGGLSYAVYVLQAAVYHNIHRAVARAGGINGIEPWVQGGVCCVILVVIASYANHYIDEPVRRALMQRLRRRRKSAV